MGCAKTGGSEKSPERALGRVLAEEVRANRDQPPYDVSAMDGFAVRGADLSTGGVLVFDLPKKTRGQRPVRAQRIMNRRPGAGGR